MRKIERFIIWICSKFIRSEIEEIIKGLQDVLANRNPNVKPKDDFKEKHPNYRNFFVSPLAPIPAEEKLKEEKPKPNLDWKELLKQYKKEQGKPLKPVDHKDNKTIVPEGTRCRTCGAPCEYLYFNDGKKRCQIKCKVCSNLNPVHPQDRGPRTKYFCPYCERALFLWKEKNGALIYKCDNDKCSHYLENRAKLNLRERILAKIKSSQFKLRYQYREYHFTQEQLQLPSPEKPQSKLFNIHNSLNTLSLILAFYVSFGISARKTAYILRKVFSIPVSYQTVLNYACYASYYCHRFNLFHKGEAETTQVEDEVFTKVAGIDDYTWLSVSPVRRAITSYLVSETRDVLPAIITTNEAIRTCPLEEKITLITDGNPSYQETIHYINQTHFPKLDHKRVIGLQNLDKESEEYRPFKEIIERLNRTYRFHLKASCGFKVPSGKLALTTLFVTHYNFLRPHQSLNYEVPIPLKELEDIPTIQGQWSKVLQVASNLVPA